MRKKEGETPTNEKEPVVPVGGGLGGFGLIEPPKEQTVKSEENS